MDDEDLHRPIVASSLHVVNRIVRFAGVLVWMFCASLCSATAAGPYVSRPVCLTATCCLCPNFGVAGPVGAWRRAMKLGRKAVVVVGR